MSSRVFCLAGLLAVSALACAGREGTETTAKHAKHLPGDGRPIELAPVVFAAHTVQTPQELAPVLCGPEADSLPPACEAMASHPQQF